MLTVGVQNFNKKLSFSNYFFIVKKFGLYSMFTFFNICESYSK